MRLFGRFRGYVSARGDEIAAAPGVDLGVVGPSTGQFTPQLRTHTKITTGTDPGRPSSGVGGGGRRTALTSLAGTPYGVPFWCRYGHDAGEVLPARVWPGPAPGVATAADPRNQQGSHR